MDLTKYRHIDYEKKINKNKIPITQFTFEQIDEFNEIYQYAKENYQLVKATKSQGISVKVSERFLERYLINVGNQRFELIIISDEGCYRFLLQNAKKKDNVIGGQDACRVIYHAADTHNIDMSKYISENGLEDQKQIERPHIKVLQSAFLNRKIEDCNVHHIDFRSSYASRISEAYPELKPMYAELFAQRKDNNGYFKHVLTNSIGCFHSHYCVDYYSRHKIVPFQFAKLAKIAINGTRAKVDDMINKLIAAGMDPLLSNTDGIWYYSENGSLYHDDDEGNELCNWQHDHVNCKFLMISEGAYQYVEDDICHSVVRGVCNLDAAKPNREDWEFGDILNIKNYFTYKFDPERGVYKTDGETI